jgi:hypothetical protein
VAEYHLLPIWRIEAPLAEVYASHRAASMGLKRGVETIPEQAPAATVN